MSLFIGYWFLGMIFGMLILFASMFFDKDYFKYWYLFVPLWPLGVLIFCLWALREIFHLIQDIFDGKYDK